MQVYIGECQVCHGTEGQGTVLGPEILHPTVDYSEWIIRTGRTHPNYPAMMPSYNTNEVSDEVLADILDWLNSAPKPTTGEELYGDFCSHCHSDDGIGTTNHAAFGENPTTDIRNGHNITNFGGRTQYMPRWDNTQITDNEINLIRQYTDSQ
jgi:mono/diheme cytochrome c family protein